ncbi:E3 SUMO-protein ligase ZBED1-like [Alosa pseudoharengus]|uniref:E3 SUMO-protein ligase ZBED1-like n=1 Tax=Alosa pseudoharengus TaxID=34774 RepID=UPI003F8CB3F0
MLTGISKMAITADGWTSVCQDHYLTVTLHYVWQGKIEGKVLCTKAVYQAQTGIHVAEEIEEVLQEYRVREKVVAATVDNAANMAVALRTLAIVRIGCFAHTLNLAAQKIIKCQNISNWAARVRSVIVWMKSVNMAKVVLKEKQKLLNLPQHMMILDVKTRWNSSYLMIKRFYEQFPAIQAAVMDPRLRKQADKEKLVENLQTADMRRAEEFLYLMGVLYTSTLCISSERSPTCGQILPILKKLEKHYAIQAQDSAFTRNIKEKIWTDLSARYQDEEVQIFLEEATVMDPRFKTKIESDAIWERLRTAAVVMAITEEQEQEAQTLEEEEDQEEVEEEDYSPPAKRRKTALEELFEEEDRMSLSTVPKQARRTIREQVDLEVQIYSSLPAMLGYVR